MINIIGGFYKELCLYPSWDYNFGSGARAAAILSNFGERLCFHSYVHKSKEKEFIYFSKVYDIDIKILPSSEIISFEYYHSLSAPNIHTLNSPIIKQKQTSLTEDIIICYGMIEANCPIINADYVVFDPQSEHNPEMILNNGSKIKHLALILNVEEGKKFTSEKSVETIAKSFFDKYRSLEVLILKDGPFGAHLFTSNKYFHIDAYETKKVFKIGSGDVFVSVFAYFWARDKNTPMEAAEKASLATAFYCNNQVLSLDKDVINNQDKFNKIKVNKEIFNKTIYLAGPFFTMADRWIIEEAKFQLEKFGANVFSPLHDVGYGTSAFVAKEDLKGVDKADILYAVLNDYDPGTIFEIGYAISRKIPVVIFIENKTQINMTMFEGSDCIIEDDFATSIYKVIWEASKTL
ncbi:MAG: PfkB family carbohydrate kinase [Campylobacterales bacterium]|nr:PfkB family carbohydrate kinase [Campylobacterales bacterium]